MKTELSTSNTATPIAELINIHLDMICKITPPIFLDENTHFQFNDDLNETSGEDEYENITQRPIVEVEYGKGLTIKYAKNLDSSKVVSLISRLTIMLPHLKQLQIDSLLKGK
jgi:hypothetical protein